MDWSLVLLSQGIESVIEPDNEGASWSLIVASRDSERAFKTLRQYSAENRGWPWTGNIAGEQVRFDFGCVGWAFVMVLFYWLSAAFPKVMSGGIMDSTKFVSGQWWRLFTAVSLHADLGHLATNLAIGIVLLGLAMGRYGTGIGLLAAFLAGAGGNVFSFLLNSKPFHGLGSSGMVMGALGLLAAQSFAPHESRGKSIKYLLVSIAAAAMLFILLGLSPESDIAAHIGGFISGLFLGAALVRLAGRNLRTAKFETAGWFLLSLLYGMTWTLAMLH